MLGVSESVDVLVSCVVVGTFPDEEGPVPDEAAVECGAEAATEVVLPPVVPAFWLLLPPPPDSAIAATMPPTTTSAPIPRPTLRPVLFFGAGIGVVWNGGPPGPEGPLGPKGMFCGG